VLNPFDLVTTKSTAEQSTSEIAKTEPNKKSR